MSKCQCISPHVLINGEYLIRHQLDFLDHSELSEVKLDVLMLGFVWQATHEKLSLVFRGIYGDLFLGCNVSGHGGQGALEIQNSNMRFPKSFHTIF